jgi:hypothetical protein
MEINEWSIDKHYDYGYIVYNKEAEEEIKYPITLDLHTDATLIYHDGIQKKEEL